MTYTKAVPASEPLTGTRRNTTDDAADADCGTATVAGLRRHRAAIYPELPLTDHQLDGAVAAAEHLMALDLPPLFRLDVIRALWRRERDRELAATLARLAGLAA